jgi:hypothetical protein
MPTLPSYAEMFRGHPACPCQVEWIPVFEAYLQALGLIDGELPIAQLIGFYSGSGSTHGDPAGDGLRKGGGCIDFWVTGRLADQVIAAARDCGADPSWHRLPGWDNGGGVEHDHVGLRGCPHRTTQALAQEYAVDHDGDGLVGDRPDPGPRPLSHRTWREGIQWARARIEELNDMQLSDKIDPKNPDSPTVGGLFRQLDRFIDRTDARLSDLKSGLLDAIDALPDGATKADVRRVVASELAKLDTASG